MGKLIVLLVSVSAGVLMGYYAPPTTAQHVEQKSVVGPPSTILSVYEEERVVLIEDPRGTKLRVYIPLFIPLSVYTEYVSTSHEIYFMEKSPSVPVEMSSLHLGEKMRISFMPIHNRLEATGIELQKRITR